MISFSTKAVKHFGKFVPCVEGRVLSYINDPCRLVRLNTFTEAVELSERFNQALYNMHYSNVKGDVGNVLQIYTLGDSYMLNQYPASAPVEA